MQDKKSSKNKRKFKPAFKISVSLILILIFGFLFWKLFFTFNLNNFKNYFTDTYKSFFKKDQDEKKVYLNSTDEFISVFKDRLSSQNLEYASSTNFENGDMQIFLKNTKNDAGYIFVNTKENVEETWTTFASALLEENLKNSLINNLINLNYIDLRFGNKVFYKFNNSNFSTVSSTTKIILNASSTKR